MDERRSGAGEQRPSLIECRAIGSVRVKSGKGTAARSVRVFMGDMNADATHLEQHVATGHQFHLFSNASVHFGAERETSFETGLRRKGNRDEEERETHRPAKHAGVTQLTKDSSV